MNEIIDVADFIGVKSYKAKGKRLSSYGVSKIIELEPIIEDEEPKPNEVPPPPVVDVPFEIIRHPDEGDISQMEINFE